MEIGECLQNNFSDDTQSRKFPSRKRFHNVHKIWRKIGLSLQVNAERWPSRLT